MIKVLLGMAVVFLGLVRPGLAEEHQVNRVKGLYKIAKITKFSERDFLTVFAYAGEVSASDDRPQDILLRTNHMHLALQEGETFEIAAEVAKKSKQGILAAQVMVNIETPTSKVPVWLLSSQYGTNDLRGARYIDMHAPVSDFMVF